MKIIDCVQGTPEWHSVRCGVPTASEFDKIITTTGTPSKQRQKYLYQLAGETITGIPEESYQNMAMQRGKEMEAEARKLYELITGQEVTQVGFCLADGYGCSPDGLVGNDGLLDIKCPTLAVHVGYLLENKFQIDYFQQVQGQLLVTKRKWVDFMSYFPGIKPFIIRVNRDEKFISALKNELYIFCSELKPIVAKIR
jgi:hypothetical protein